MDEESGVVVIHWFPEVAGLTVPHRVPFRRRQRSCLIQRSAEQVEFASSVSRELRIPLTSIKGFVDTLLRSRDQLTEEQQLHFLEIIKDQADCLTRWVEDWSPSQ